MQKPQQRNDTLGFSFCAKSCQDNLCNLHSCQLPDNSTKPPRCLSCDSVDSPSQCQNVVECNSNEVCFSEKVFTFHRVVYRFGCVSVKDCNAHPVHAAAIVGKRNDEKSCSVCCKTDHCNLQACSNNPGQVFPMNPISPGVCADSNAALCSTFGRLSADACKEQTVLNACSSSCATCAHIGWNSWQPWGTCSARCGLGTRTRTRTCRRRFSFVGSPDCVGPSTSSGSCSGQFCPVNGGWCYNSKIECKVIGLNYDVCLPTNVKTTCSCPSPRYGGHYCD